MERDGGQILEESARASALPWVGVALVAAVTAWLAVPAADLRWLDALGGSILRHGVPHGVPYAALPTGEWVNVPVLGELVVHALAAVPGERGLLAAQVAAVTTAAAAVSRDARRLGAGDRAVLVVLVALVPAGVAALLPIRSQLFSLALFPPLVALLREETRRLSPRIWLLLPLVAVWSNLHGAVLTGVAVAAAYLVVERLPRRPLEALGVLAGLPVALCLTPAGTDTPRYYLGVLHNASAVRHVGLWAPPSPTRLLDALFLVVIGAMVAAAWRARRPRWEELAALGLALLTARAARGEIWLLLLLAPAAAAGLGGARRAPARSAATVALGLSIVAVVGLVRGPLPGEPDASSVQTVLRLAAGRPVLAEDRAAEALAAAGGRVLVANPLDAFRPGDQHRYLDWLEGRPGGDALLRARPAVVLALTGSPADRRLRHVGGYRPLPTRGGVRIWLPR